ncbi:MAG: lipid II flippase MurJ [Mariprofundus sp.]
MKSDSVSNVSLPLWVALFCYSTVVALLFQKLLLPGIPSLHAGHGLMSNDAIYFHQVAEAMAAHIQAAGWSWDALWSNSQGARGNVTILAILYALFGPDPSLILPINAAFHATSGLLLYLIVQLLCPGRVGQVAGVLAALLFVMFPSSINWYAQVHKDGYAIAGTLLVLYSWLRFLNQHAEKRAILWFVAGSLAGISLILFVRPYNTMFLAVASVTWFTIVLCTTAVRGEWSSRWKYLLVVVSMICLFAWVAISIGMKATSESNVYNNWNGSQSSQACLDWKWQASEIFPEAIESLAEKAARTRAGLLCAHYDAASNVDREQLPDNIGEVIAYMPRAMVIALLGPFPDMWVHPFSMARLVGGVETLVWYLLIPGFILALIQLRSEGVLLCLVFALVYLAIYGFTIGNMGTLHRVRYPFLFIFIATGVLGWVYALSRNAYIRYRLAPKFSRSEVKQIHAESLLLSDESDAEHRQDAEALRKKAVTGGILVSLITALSFVGFFFRDVLMANTFGIGSQIDAFFIAMLIPMFFVNVFGQSFGATSVSVYMQGRQQSEQYAVNVVSYLAFKITFVLLVLGLLLSLLAPVLLPLMGWGFSSDTLELTRYLFYGTMPLLLFSGMVILGNAILSARMNFTAPAWSQAVVPVSAIVFLIVAGEQLGVAAVLLGMVVGQLLNLGLVQIYLKREHLSVIPKRDCNAVEISKSHRRQFVSLILAAMFLQVSLLVDNGMASSLQEGSVAALGLGYKVVFFVTGIIGTGISMALLPYFVHFIVKQDFVTANRELSMLVSLATLLGMFVSLVVYYMAPPLLEFLFAKGKVDAEDIDTVIRVVHMGILQVPFFACQLILIKYATAANDNRAILTASVAGMIINIILNYVLMQRMGVGGIAAATTLSMFCSASILLWMVHRKGNMSWVDVLFSGLVWILFLTMMLCIHFESYSGVVVSVIAMLLAIFILNYEKASMDRQPTEGISD